MAVPLLVAFGLSCLLLIAHGFRKRSGVLEFPFLAGCGMLGFLFPQAVGIIRNPEMAPEAGVNKALLMCILCTLAIYAGWTGRVPASWRRVRDSPSPKLLYRIGLGCLAVGIFGYLMLTSLSGGITEFYSAQGAYSLEWRGLPVAYNFFASYLYPGYVLIVVAAMRLRSRIRLLPASATVLIALAAVVFLGRRGILVWLALSTGCLVYFARRFTVPRSLVAVIAPLFALAMFLAPQYRSHSPIGAETEGIGEISVSEALDQVFSGSRAEFWSMVYLTEIADSERAYQYGAGFYNRFIYMFVPRLIVGDDVKQALFVDVPSAGHTPNSYGWTIPNGMVPSGPFSAFEQFWYFGALCFYFLSRVMRYFYVQSTSSGSLWAQIVYAASLPHAIHAVVTNLFWIYGIVFTFLLPMGALLWRSGQIGRRRCVTRREVMQGVWQGRALAGASHIHGS